MDFDRRIAIFLFLMIFTSCKSLKNSITTVSTRVDTSLQKITEGFEEIKSEFVPFDTLVRQSMIAAIEGIEDEQSQKNLDSITQRFNHYLARAIDSLHLGIRAHEIMDSLKSSFLDEETKDEIGDMLQSAIRSARVELDLTVDELIDKLTSVQNKEKLRSLTSDLISDELKNDLSDALNHAIANLDLTTLSEKINRELLTTELKDTLKNLLNEPVARAGETGKGLLGMLRKYVGYILLGILAVAASIIFLIYKFRRKKSHDVASLIMEKISEKSDNEVIKDLKKDIKKSAEQKDLEPYLNQRLRKENLL